ncbi:MAG TPA: phosphotransferase [Thermomicrobiales bacterium]|nr:phosphotransferase [Thermomicrobiales bacterium]
MTEFDLLSYREQVKRLRRLARMALAEYDLGPGPARLSLLAHMDNTTFRVDTDGGGRFTLRVHRVSHSPAQPRRTLGNVRSELEWLDALRRDAGLDVPRPIASRRGALALAVETADVPGARVCSLLGWIDGRFVNVRLTPVHLERVGAFIARLHDHSSVWTPPAGFERGRVGELPEDVAVSILEAIADRCEREDVATVERAIHDARQAQRELGHQPGFFGLIHGDLHQDNYLFNADAVRAIDFDDCGWGWLLYDLAVPLSEIRFRPAFPELRAALLRGYERSRRLPVGCESGIDAFIALRYVQLAVWFLEHRDHPGFAEWELDVRYLLRRLRRLAAGLD